MSMVLPSAAGAVAPDFHRRWELARGRAAAKGLTALYVTSGPTFTWLSGFAPYPGGWPDWVSCVVLPVDAEPAIVISRMHAQILDESRCPVRNVFTYVDGQDPRGALKQALAATGVKEGVVGLEDHIWFSDVELLGEVAPSLRLRRTPLFESLRAVKEPGEIALLRRSAACQDAAFAQAVQSFRDGADLSEAEASIRSAMLANGCESIKLLGVFKSPRPRPLKAPELVDIDFGTAFCDGYTIDSSRNVFIGEPPATLLDQYRLVLDAYTEATGTLRPGVDAAAVHRAGAATIASGGESQTWKMGHGVGLSDGHEPPWLQEGSEVVLEEGMVFTIDPGFFVGRDLPLHLENSVLITATGWESLNQFSDELIVVP